MKNRGIIVALVLFAAMSAAAQQQDPVGVVTQVLQLSPDQVTPWVEILHSRQAAIEPLAQQMAARQQEIGQALESGTPDPAAIGRALIEIHALQKQAGMANASAVAQFDALLTPDQRDRWNAIRSAAHVCPVVPAFQAAGIADPW